MRPKRTVVVACTLAVLVGGPRALVAQTADPLVLCSCATTTASGWTNPNDCSQPTVSPDAGFAQPDSPLASPTQQFEQTFTAAAGTYHVWVRLRALSNSKYNDSIWLQFSDAVNSSNSAVYRIGSTSGLLVNLATDSAATSLNGWGWQDGAYWLTQTPKLNFATSGSHTIRVQVREDGVSVDQIVLSAAKYLTASPGILTNDATRLACTVQSGTPPPTTPAPAAVANPSPAASATGTATSVALTWTAAANATSYDVSFGTVNPPPRVSTAQTATAFQPPSALATGTTYFWRVDANGPGGTTAGPVWSFTTLTPPPAPPPPPAAPGAVTGPTPAAGATAVAATTAVAWLPAANATTYDVSFGTANPPPAVVKGQTATSYQPPSLTPATTYFWKVDATGAGGTTAGTVWSFTTVAPTAPSAPGGPAPVDGGTAALDMTTLSWQAVANATSYHVSFGTTNPPPRVSTAQTPATYQLTVPVAAGTKYFWRVDANGAGGTAAGPIWTFTTAAPTPPPPAAAANPLPADAAANALTTIALNWAASANAVAYNVAFGTTNPPPSVATRVAATSWQPPAALAYSTTYYWTVDAVGAAATTPGAVWRFTTAAAPPPPSAPDATTTNNTALSRLRVVNWNVAQGYNPVTHVNDYDLQVDLLASLNPDVVTLQEMSYADADMVAIFTTGLSSRTGRQWKGYYQRTNALTTPTTDNSGSAILTWLPVDAESHTLIATDAAHPFEALHLQVTINKVPVHVSTTHLYASDATVRAGQIGSLQTWLSTQGSHRIVTGDFNAFPGETTTWTTPWTTEYTDAWTAATSWVQPTNDAGYTFDKRTATQKPERIDYHWLKGVALTEMFVVKTRRSDHHVVVADYKIQ